MSDAGKKILFFYVEPFTGRYHSPKDNVVLLDSYLKPEEHKRFEEKYKSLGLDEKFLKDSMSHKTLEVVDFPLMLKDKETSANLFSYVSEWMDGLPENLKLFCAYVGFVFKYSDLGINQTLLKSVWKDSLHSTIHSYSEEQKNAIAKLLVEESDDDGTLLGIWRPRYNRFSEFLLSAYKNNWENGISKIAKDFILLCKESGELGSDDRDMLYSVFIIRKNADYRAIEDRENIKNKFSLLIKDMDDIERAESLFNTLVDSFPQDAVFRGHFARFLYEKTTMLKDIDIDDRLFEDAQANLNLAFEINPDDADLHHMQGMLLRRKIRALSKMFKHDSPDGKDDVDIQDVEDCLHDWTNQAYEAFERSIQLSPASPYGYAAESQLFKESIMLGKDLLGCKDYSFCETSSIYSDYSEKLGTVLDLFEQICYAFKNDGLSQIMNSYPIYENVRVFHQNIVGLNAESIQRYRTMYGTASGEKKLLYGNLLVKSIMYSKKSSNKDTRRTYSVLTQRERKEIEQVLEFQKNQGDVKSYETLFFLKLYGPDEFSLDETIDLLKEWERQYENGNQIGWGYLNACFYLAVCYCAKSIMGDVQNKELTSLAMTYFKKSEDFAKRFDKGTVLPLCYLGEQSDIHCIVDKSRKDSDAGTITGVIKNITKDNKGILMTKCGIEVSFNANKFDIIHDEGQTLRGVLGFSYRGPGLYDFRPETDSELNAMFYEKYDEEEITFDDLDKSYAPTEDLVEEVPADKSNGEKSGIIGIRIVDQIDVTKFETSKNRFPKSASKTNKRKKFLEQGDRYEGVVVKVSNFLKIKCDSYPYPLEIRGCVSDEELYEDDVVSFTAGNEPNNNDSSKTYWFAYDVELKDA